MLACRHLPRFGLSRLIWCQASNIRRMSLLLILSVKWRLEKSRMCPSRTAQIGGTGKYRADALTEARSGRKRYLPRSDKLMRVTMSSQSCSSLAG